MAQPKTWYVLVRPDGPRFVEVVAVYESEKEARKAQKATELDYTKDVADEPPKVGESYPISEPGRELEGAFHWRYVPAKCIDERLSVRDDVKISFLGNRDNPTEITAGPAGRVIVREGEARHVVVERDVKPDGSLTVYGHIISEHRGAEDALDTALRKERGRELQRGPCLQDPDRDLTRER